MDSTGRRLALLLLVCVAISAVFTATGAGVPALLAAVAGLVAAVAGLVHYARVRQST